MQSLAIKIRRRLWIKVHNNFDSDCSTDKLPLKVKQDWAMRASCMCHCLVRVALPSINALSILVAAALVLLLLAAGYAVVQGDHCPAVAASGQSLLQSQRLAQISVPGLARQCAKALPRSRKLTVAGALSAGVDIG